MNTVPCCGNTCDWHPEHDEDGTPRGRRCGAVATHRISWLDGTKRYSFACADHVDLDPLAPSCQVQSLSKSDSVQCPLDGAVMCLHCGIPLYASEPANFIDNSNPGLGGCHARCVAAYFKAKNGMTHGDDYEVPSCRACGAIPPGSPLPDQGTGCPPRTPPDICLQCSEPFVEGELVHFIENAKPSLGGCHARCARAYYEPMTTVRVWCEPPRGPSGGRGRAHVREVSRASEIDQLQELARKRFTFSVDGVGKTWEEISEAVRKGQPR